MSWSIAWTSRARKDLRKLDGQVAARIFAAIERFARTGAGDIVQLTDIEPPEYRLRVGAWRVRFRRDSALIIILRALPRDKAY